MMRPSPGVCGVVCCVFVIMKVPETKGSSLEQMDEVFATFRPCGESKNRRSFREPLQSPRDSEHSRFSSSFGPPAQQ